MVDKIWDVIIIFQQQKNLHISLYLSTEALNLRTDSCPTRARALILENTLISCGQSYKEYSYRLSEMYILDKDMISFSFERSTSGTPEG